MPFRARQAPKAHRERIALIPEILPGNAHAVPNVRAFAIPKLFLRVGEEARVPQPKQYPGRKERLPVIVRADDLVHQPEEACRVVLDFDVDVEFDVLVLGLTKTINEQSKTELQDKRAPS